MLWASVLVIEGESGLKYKPVKTMGAVTGLVLGVLGFGSSIWAVNYALVQPDEQTLKLLLLVPIWLFAVFYAYILWGAFNLAYLVTDKGLTIRWASRAITIPWPEISGVVRVTGTKNLVNLTGVSWPGYMVGNYTLRGFGLVKMYASDFKGPLVIVQTPKGNFGLTPENEKQFLQEVAGKSQAEIQELDCNQLSPEVRGRLVSEDMTYMALYALSFVILAGVILYQLFFFPGSGASRTVVLFPALGMGVLVFNIGNASRTYHFVPAAAYLIWGLNLLIMTTFLVLSVITISF